MSAINLQELNMAKAEFEKIGKSAADFMEVTTKKFAQPNDVSGGGSSVDPYGDNMKKGASDMDMNSAAAFNSKFVNKVEAMGTDCPTATAAKNGQRSDNKGDHFSTEQDNASVPPYGSEAGKSQSYQSKH